MPKLLLNSKLSTPYSIAYSGDLKELTSHSEGDKFYSPYEYVDTKKLRKFLIKEKFITKDEYPLCGGSNGTCFWIFYRNLERHKSKVNRELKGKTYAYLPADPINMADNESGLVTSAFTVNRMKKYPSGFYCEPTLPSEFNKGSFLKVERIVQFKPNFMHEFDQGKFWDAEDGNHNLNLFLSDLRARFYGEVDEVPQLTIINYGYGYPQGVHIRNVDYATSRWAQKNMLPIFKKILNNHAASEAILIKQELVKVKLPYSSEEHEARKRIRRKIADEQIKTLENFKSKHYIHSLESAAKELSKDKRIVEALRLI